MRTVRKNATSAKCNGFWEVFILGAWSCNEVQFCSLAVKKGFQLLL